MTLPEELDLWLRVFSRQKNSVHRVLEVKSRL